MNEWALQTFQLNHQYAKGPIALEDINLNIRRGDIFAIIGPTGCGKTTLLTLLSGALKTQEGRIELFGYDPHRYRNAVASRVGCVFDTLPPHAQFTVRDTLETYRKKYDLAEARLVEMMCLTGVAEVAARRVDQLSAGMRRRLAIAIALLPRPEFLILDEPSKGLDLPGKSWLIDLLKALNRDRRVTIIMSSQCDAEVKNLATRVGMMSQGRLVFQGSLNDLLLCRRPKLFIHTSDNRKAAGLLHNYPLELTEEGFYVPYLDEYQTAMINRELVDHKLDVYVLQPAGRHLEELVGGLAAGSGLFPGFWA